MCLKFIILPVYIFKKIQGNNISQLCSMAGNTEGREKLRREVVEHSDSQELSGAT